MSKALGQQCKKWRKRYGLTQIEAAQKAGLSQSYYSRIENGECTPRLPILLKIGEVFGIGLDELTGSQSKKPKKPTKKAA